MSSLPPSDDDHYITVTEARRLLKTSHDSILPLVKTGEIAFGTRNQDKTLGYFLWLADVESVRIKYERAWGSRELAKQLGVDQKVINGWSKKDTYRKEIKKVSRLLPLAKV